MNIRQTIGNSQRQTTSDEVYQQLRSDIISMQLKPGTKLSEVEVAKQYGVSRQPVREAFMRLGDLDLLEIRPQRATLVRKISLQDLSNTRFIRASVEVEVIREACKVASDDDIAPLKENLVYQSAAVETHDPATLKELDYHFHRLICEAAHRSTAFKIIAENKSHTDRVCSLELADPQSMRETFEGHVKILDALKKRDEELAVKVTRIHLAHLDSTLKLVHQNHPEYFED